MYIYIYVCIRQQKLKSDKKIFFKTIDSFTIFISAFITIL